MMRQSGGRSRQCTFRRLTLSLVFAVVHALQAHAQTDAFEAEMSAVLEPAGSRAILLDCAGLFRAFRLYSGSETEIGLTAAGYETDLATVATVVWQAEENVDMDAAMSVIVPLIGDATELYLDRFVANDAATANVLDEGLERKLAFCATLSDRLMESME